MRGNVFDPQIRRRIPDSFISLLAELARTSRADRQAAAAFTDAALRPLSGSQVTADPTGGAVVGAPRSAAVVADVDVEAAAGRAKAEIMCQTCHGLDGIATVPMAANLSGQQEAYLIVQLEAYRDGKRRHEQMSIIAGSLSDDDIKNLAAWYSQIKVIVEIPQ